MSSAAWQSVPLRLCGSRRRPCLPRLVCPPSPYPLRADSDCPVWGQVSTWSEGSSRSLPAPHRRRAEGGARVWCYRGVPTATRGPRSGEGSDLREKKGLYGQHICRGGIGCRGQNGQRGDSLKPCPLCPPPAPGWTALPRVCLSVLGDLEGKLMIRCKPSRRLQTQSPWVEGTALLRPRLVSSLCRHEGDQCWCGRGRQHLPEL